MMLNFTWWVRVRIITKAKANLEAKRNGKNTATLISEVDLFLVGDCVWVFVGVLEMPCFEGGFDAMVVDVCAGMPTIEMDSVVHMTQPREI